MSLLQHISWRDWRTGLYILLFVFILSGCGGGSSSESDTDLVSTNTAPVANAGADKTVSTGDTINTSGAQSSDTDGDALTYTWSLTTVPTGSNASLSSTSLIEVNFVADIDGTYVVTLIVNDGTIDSIVDTVSIIASSEASSSSAITQGLATTILANLFPSGGRIAGIGTIDDTDGISWTVPAVVRFDDSSMPTASDLHNIYVSGHEYTSAANALAALDGSDVIEIDPDGEIITAYIFADNYFELYINGTAVGKDPVPFTDFNSNIVRFKVKQPFTVAMLLVDWEENLGTGTEDNQGSTSHPGDGGMVAVFKDSSNEIISVTDNSWKAQTYYTAPITDLSCLSESGTLRLSTNCSTDAAGDFSSIYGVHWARPSNWMKTSFDDSGWPSASTFTNATVGVDNKASYTNFTDIFDDNNNDAQFIWSTNLVLDNEILVRATVGSSGSFSLSSKAVKDNLILPLSATCEGVNKGASIDLIWSDAPTGTQSFAVTMHQYPNPADEGDLSKAHSYWTLYDIPATTLSLSTGQTNVGVWGTNTVDEEQTYTAPCSQAPESQTYTITLYALSSNVGSLGLTGNTTDIVTLTNAIASSTLETKTLALEKTRYNQNESDHVPSSVPSTCATKSAAFEGYNDVTVSCDSTTMTVTTSTFLPYRSQLDSDKPDVGIKSWIGRVPIPAVASWTLPLQPSYLSSVESNLNIHDAIGISVEGIPILHYAKENTNGEIAIIGTDYSDRDTVLLGEIDQCGAHAGNGEDYHYHMAPLCMMDSHDVSQPIAYMFDGIPLYFGTAGGVMTGGVSTNYGAGRYTDLNYLPADVKSGANPLDECNAYALGDGTYVYYTTTEAPYTIGCYRGVADQSSSVPHPTQWTVDRNLAWSGSGVELTDHDTMVFEDNTWSFIEVTPTSNSNIATGKTGRIMYRQLVVEDTGYDENANCYAFRYRLDNTDITGSNDTADTHCR